MRKYWAFFRMGYRSHLSNRMKVNMRIGCYILFCVVFAMMWNVILTEGLFAFPFNLTEIIWYTVVVQWVSYSSPRWYARIEDDVRSGDIVYFLTRPLSYLRVRLAEGCGALAVNALFLGIAGMVIGYLITGWMPPIGALLAAYFLAAIGAFFHIVMQIPMGLTTFWTKDGEVVYRVYHRFLLLFGALYFPVQVYPGWLQNLAYMTPFPFMMSWPAQVIYQEDWQPMFLQCLGMLILWGTALYGATVWIYSRSLKYIEVHGG